MKEPMKHIILAAAMLCGTVHAAMPGVPSKSQTCKLVGAVFFAVQTMSAAGFNKPEIGELVKRAMRVNMPTLGPPPYTDLVIGYAWDSAQKNPKMDPNMAEQKARADCLEE